MVINSSFSSTEEQFSLADVWLQENSLAPDDPDLAPMLPSASTCFLISKGAQVDHSLVYERASFAPGRSVASKGAWNVDFHPFDLPLASKGDSSLPFCTPDCEGDNLQMPPMVNLETAGLC